MITIHEIITYMQPLVVKQIEQVWGPLKVEWRRSDPEDDYNFRYFDKMMREKPRRR